MRRHDANDANKRGEHTRGDLTLEPTVRVGTPEILLPLQHLTTSLEMAAHYNMLRNLNDRVVEARKRGRRGY